MAEEKALRLSKVAKEFNVGLQHVVEFLESKGVSVEKNNPNAKISTDVYVLLQEKYQPDKLAKLDAQEVTKEKQKRDLEIINAARANNLFTSSNSISLTKASPSMPSINLR